MARFRRGPGRNWEGRSWVTSASLNALMDEIEAAFPTRHPADGTVASRGHDRNNPSSDHRPYPYSGPGIVNAVDSGGREDGFVLTEALRASRDPRIRYVIFDRRIFASYSRPGRQPWQWGSYSGSSHATHVHVSVNRSNQGNGDPWNLGLGGESEEQMFPLRYQDGWTSGPRPNKRDDVAFLQAMFGLEYGDQQGFYGPTTAADIAAKLGVSDPVNEFGWEQAQLAAEKGIFVGGNASYSKTEADARFAGKQHPHTIT